MAKFGEWIPITYDEEGNINCELPDDEQDIIVSRISKRTGRKWIDYDEFCDNGKEIFLSSCTEWEEVTAWMPFPDPYEGEKDE